MAEVVIYKSPVQGGLNEEKAMAWEALANDLRGVGHQVTRADNYMLPGRRGIIWGEVVLIAVGWKVLDAATDHVVDAAIDRIFETAKTWGRERFAKRAGNARKAPTSVRIVDEDGKSIGSWKIDAEGEQEVRSNAGERPDAEDGQQVPRLPWEVESAEATEAELSALTMASPDVQPPIWVMLTLTDCDDDGCLVTLDVFVERERRSHIQNVWSFPKRFIVTPPNGSPTPFALEEDDGEPLGVRLTAPGWRCQLHEIDSERYLYGCNPE